MVDLSTASAAAAILLAHRFPESSPQAVAIHVCDVLAGKGLSAGDAEFAVAQDTVRNWRKTDSPRLRLVTEAGKVIPDPTESGQPQDSASPRRNPRTGTLDLRPRLESVDFNAGAEFTPPSWLVKGMLPQQGIGLLFGESGAGKTFLAIHTALCVATGVPFFGNRTRQGGVLYVAAEGGSSVIPRMNAAAGKMPPDKAPIRIVTEAPNLSRDGKPMALTATIDDAAADFEKAGSRLALIVIDTWHAALGGGDENSAADSGVALAPLREAAERHGALVLVLHHPGKDVERGARGSNALPAAADAIIALKVPGHGGSVGKPSDAVRTASVTKLRDGETGVGFSYRLPVVPLGTDEDGDPWTTCVVEPHDIEPVVPISPSVREFLTALESALAEHEGDRAATEAVREKFYAGRPEAKPDTARKAFNRARDAALEAGKVGVDAGQEWVWKI